MNTISEPAVSASGRAARGSRFRATLAALALGGCIQGPWDYYPKDPPVFKGIWLSGYAMAGKPITQVCMEKYLSLGEESTDAFAFYDSATIQVTGRFGDSTGDSTATLTLARRADAPNCFAGDPAALVKTGEAYALRARVVWDSSGIRIVDTLTATARVPETFSIRTTAVASSFAKTGGLPPDIFTLEFYSSLPDEVREDPIVSQRFTEGLELYQKEDTVALQAYIAKHQASLRERLGELLEKYQDTYQEGDTLFYLGGVLNTLSHYYTSDYSADVGAVLITHRFDSTAESPENAFAGIFGIEPDSSEYYTAEGSVRRLGLYPAVRVGKDHNLLDSIGVVNPWFFTGLNRLYFYGMESAYREYGQTVIENDANSRVKPKYNVTGGAGFFVGGVPDSFDLHIKLDTYTKGYSLPAVHGSECSEDGWYSEKDCSTYYRTYCAERDWGPESCDLDAVNADLSARWKGDSLLDSSLHAAAAAAAARADGMVIGMGAERFCVENGFPDFEGTCDRPRNECGQPGINGCKESLWNHCRDVQWGPPQCAEGLAWYCRDNGRPSEVMCRRADEFCRDNPGNAACR